MSGTVRISAPQWRDVLGALGFEPAARANEFRRNGLLVEHDPRWVCVRDLEPRTDGDPWRGQLGRPGLWKLTATAPGGEFQRVFQFPLSVLVTADDTVAERHAAQPARLGACLEWALDTAGGTRPSHWQAPPPEAVAARVPADRLTVERAGHVRQGTLHCSMQGLCLSFPVLHRWPSELPERRLAWLRAVLMEAQSDWRMVRVGFTENGAVQAEVDWTGAPPAMLEGLLEGGLASARFFVEAIMESADLLADATVASRLVEVCEPRAQSRRKDHHADTR